MKSFPFAVAVIAQTSYAAKVLSSPPTVVEEFSNRTGHKYHWYDAPHMSCVAYAEDYSYIEYFGANECCLEANLGCERADPDARKDSVFLHFDETGMTCRGHGVTRMLSEGHPFYRPNPGEDEDEIVKLVHGY